MPWLKQQVHEVLAGAKGAVDLQSELAGVNAKLQAALRGEVGVAALCLAHGSAHDVS